MIFDKKVNQVSEKIAKMSWLVNKNAANYNNTGSRKLLIYTQNYIGQKRIPYRDRIKIVKE